MTHYPSTVWVFNTSYNHGNAALESNMPFGLQPVHLLLIALIALLIFGPNRLSRMGRSLVNSLLKHLREAQEMTREFRAGLNDPDGRSTPGRPDPISRVSPGSSAQLGYVCSFCGTPNPPQARYCNKCGISLSE
jgi:Sec-independent protein translocase protein TatA